MRLEAKEMNETFNERYKGSSPIGHHVTAVSQAPHTVNP